MLRHIRIFASIFFVIFPLIGAGCARSSSQSSSDAVIALTAPLFPPAVGSCALRFSVTDTAGNPIDDAVVTAKADMSHAGMTPVLATASAEGNGVYTVPTFAWSMAGDWILTVDAQLADGTTASTQFDIPVDRTATTCETPE
jgi:hypothetical protein